MKIIRSSQFEYLRKAKEAEKEEQRAYEPSVKAAWERIAVGYLELAHFTANEGALLPD